MKQRVAARLLLASCTLALGLGLGTAVAVTGVLALQHPDLRVRAGGEAVGHLEPGTHELFVLRNDPVPPAPRGRSGPGGEPPVSQSPPVCTITDLRTAGVAPPASTDAGFAAVQIARAGRHRVACTSAMPGTVLVEQRGEPASAYLAAAGRGLLLAVVFTALAALLAARALVTAGRLRSASAS